MLTIKFASLQGFCDIQLAFSNDFIYPRLLRPTGDLEYSRLLLLGIKYRKSKFFIPFRMLSAFDFDLCLLCGIVDGDLGIDVLLEEVLVEQVPSFEDDDDQGADLCAHRAVIERALRVVSK